MNETIDSNIFQAALDAGKALGQPIKSDPKTDPREAIIVIPENYKAEAIEKILEPYLEVPRRIASRILFHDAKSFIAYVDDFKSGDTRIFVNVPKGGAPSFVAILDYHSVEGPAWCAHRATLQCSFTEEWCRWMSNNGVRKAQVEFAQFLEENTKLIVNPPGAELLELISTLEGHNNINVSQAVKLNNGRVKIAYEEDVVLKGVGSIQNGAMELPLTIKTNIQMFEGGTVYAMDNRLRYRIEPRKITFWYEAVDPHVIIKDGVKDIVNMIETDLEITPLFGLST